MSAVILKAIDFGCVVYEGEMPPPSLCDRRTIAALVDEGLLRWQRVIWASKRIAKLTPAGSAAIESGRHT
jgi:hypothetical protein